jgi:hypothetical protein
VIIAPAFESGDDSGSDSSTPVVGVDKHPDANVTRLEATFFNNPRAEELVLCIQYEHFLVLDPALEVIEECPAHGNDRGDVLVRGFLEGTNHIHIRHHGVFVPFLEEIR